MVLRATAFCFTLIAAVVAGVDHETHKIPITISDNMPSFTVSVTAKCHYLSSSVRVSCFSFLIPLPAIIYSFIISL
ncbi:hypothetical protein R6Q57_004356 [Mikania cordata]